MVGSQEDLPKYSDLSRFHRLLDLVHTMMVFATDWLWLIDHFNDLGFVSQIPW